MTSNDIRAVGIVNEGDAGCLAKFQCIMLQEIAAQLATLNEYLVEKSAGGCIAVATFKQE